MSLYGDYLHERLGKFTVERDDGFAVFSYVTWSNEPAVYIEEIYVVPEARQKNVASAMADEIVAMAHEAGIKKMIGSVCPSANGATRSLKVLLGYGFELAAIHNNLIMFLKDI